MQVGQRAREIFRLFRDWWELGRNENLSAEELEQVCRRWAEDADSDRRAVLLDMADQYRKEGQPA